MKLSVAAIVEATHASNSASTPSLPADTAFDGVSIDSREVTAGELFVPIVALRDGHDFIDDALTRGATGFLCRREHPLSNRPEALVVADTTIALQDLARAMRRRLPEKLAAITGSVGKTSTKDLTAAILRVHGPTIASAKSFNNELGVPLTLLNGPDDAWSGVLEMGARGTGHISFLCDIARPTIGLITNIGSAHLEKFGSRDAIADAKSELLASLPASGVGVLDRDGDLFDRLAARSSAPIVSFSATGDRRAPVVAEDIVVDHELRVRFRLLLHGESAVVELGARGRHQVSNALGAATVAHHLGSSLGEIVDGLATTKLSPLRMEVLILANTLTLLNDTYNANPVSMRAALDALAGLGATRRIAVLGTMAELGDGSVDMHRSIADHAQSLDVDTVLSVNEPSYGVENFDSIEMALQALLALDLGPGDALLVKGSRVAGLERLVAAYKNSLQEEAI